MVVCRFPDKEYEEILTAGAAGPRIPNTIALVLAEVLLFTGALYTVMVLSIHYIDACIGCLQARCTQ